MIVAGDIAAVIGLGLVGGSVARELASLGAGVIGFDRSAAAVESAMRDGVLVEGLSDDWSSLRTARLVVVATPVDEAPEVLRKIARHAEAAELITDVGSTKLSTTAAARRSGIIARFVGSHPMAGDHRSGWSASRSDLFRGARVYLCPAPETAPRATALAHELWTVMGARPETIDAEEHDRRLAWTSHLPQLTAAALALALDGAGHARRDLGPGGLDTTRLAGSSPEMWTAIGRDNAAAIQAALATMEGELRALRLSLTSEEGAHLHHRLTNAREWFER